MFSKTYTLTIYHISVPSPGTDKTTYRQPFDSAYGAKAMTSAGRSQKCIGTKTPVFIRSMNCWAPRMKSVPKRGSTGNMTTSIACVYFAIISSSFRKFPSAFATSCGVDSSFQCQLFKSPA